jgi:HSP20 family protein
MARGPFFNRPAGGRIFGGEPLETLQREVNRVFDEIWRNLPGGEESTPGVRSISIDLSETPTQIRVRADLPGVAESDVDVTLDDDRLTIHAERRSETRGPDETPHAAERAVGVYQRTVRLPATVDANQVDARFERGVLIVTLDKPRGPEKGRKIPVRGAAPSTGATASASTGASASSHPASGSGFMGSGASDSTTAGGATGGTPESGSLTGGAGGSAEGAGGFGFIQGDGAVGPSPSTGAGAVPTDEPDNATRPGGAVHGYNE